MAKSNALKAESESEVVLASPSTSVLLDLDFGTEIVTIYVGHKRKEFIVHKKPLCESADFFKAAFSSGYEETKSSEMYMSEDHPGAFALYVNWVYRSIVARGHTESHLQSLYYLYFLVEKLCLVVLKDKVMDTIQDMAREYDLRDQIFTKFLIQEIQKHTTQLQEGKILGLGHFCMYIMVETHRLRSPTAGTACGNTQHSSNANSTNNANSSSFRAIKNSFEIIRALNKNKDEIPIIEADDIKFVWELSRDNLEFFKIYLDWYARSTVWHSRVLGDCRMRCENDEEDRCFFHCHEEGYDCRAEPEKPQATFIADITESSTQSPDN